MSIMPQHDFGVRKKDEEKGIIPDLEKSGLKAKDEKQRVPGLFFF
jgi:hypothetical protein